MDILELVIFFNFLMLFVGRRDREGGEEGCFFENILFKKIVLNEKEMSKYFFVIFFCYYWFWRFFDFI